MNSSTVGPNTIVLNALNASLARVNAITDAAEHKKEMSLLVRGSQADAKVVSVFNIWRVQEMISRSKFTCKIKLADGNVCYRFGLPGSYTAFKAYARVDELCEEFADYILRKKKDGEEGGLLLEVRPVQNGEGEVSYRLHAPRIIPRKTDRVTFILNSTEDALVEWFAGELPRAVDAFGSITGNFDLGRQWVRLGSYNPPKDKPAKKKTEAHSARRQVDHGLTTGVGELLEQAQAAAQPLAHEVAELVESVKA